jgi:hypothetical protein
MIAGASFVKIKPAAARVADSVYTTGGVGVPTGISVGVGVGLDVPVGTKSERGTLTTVFPSKAGREVMPEREETVCRSSTLCDSALIAFITC